MLRRVDKSTKRAIPQSIVMKHDAITLGSFVGYKTQQGVWGSAFMTWASRFGYVTSFKDGGKS
eukprot:47188-Eustigmatos_ZCMA.PRE.1